MGVTGKLPAPKQTIGETFGLKKFRPGQQGVICPVMEGHDTLAIMSTGRLSLFESTCPSRQPVLARRRLSVAAPRARPS